jgi:hypothetical protein
VRHLGARGRTTHSQVLVGTTMPTLVMAKGKLPAGLKLTKTSGKLTITGKAKASAAGRHVLTFTATNVMGQTHHKLTIVVKRG